MPALITSGPMPSPGMEAILWRGREAFLAVADMIEILSVLVERPLLPWRRQWGVVSPP